MNTKPNLYGVNFASDSSERMQPYETIRGERFFYSYDLSPGMSVNELWGRYADKACIKVLCILERQNLTITHGECLLFEWG